jgi:hypothetical protein
MKINSTTNSISDRGNSNALLILHHVVGAICINVDVNYLTDDVMKDKERIEAFFKNLCRTDMQLGENILSKDEYAKALKGKRHFKDEQF